MAMVRAVAMFFAVVVLLFTFVPAHGIYEGKLECEELTALECAFAVSSIGARCVLEKSTLPNGQILPSCQTSLIMAERPAEWIESEDCIQGCGLDRETYGLSTDGLMEAGFVDKLCSSECQNNCPNVIDIYSKLAAGEGVYLPRFCHEAKFKARRLIADPVPAAQNGLEGGRGGAAALRSSLASAGTPSPEASPVYGPVPAPIPYPRLPKGKKPLPISPAASPSPTPVASPTPAPSSSAPVYQFRKVSSTRFGNDFDDEEY